MNRCFRLQLANSYKALILLLTKNKDTSTNHVKKEIYHSNFKSAGFSRAQEHLNKLGLSKKHNRLS